MDVHRRMSSLIRPTTPGRSDSDLEGQATQAREINTPPAITYGECLAEVTRAVRHVRTAPLLDIEATSDLKRGLLTFHLDGLDGEPPYFLAL